MKATETHTLPDLDINYKAFQKMKQNQEWLKENLDYYVAFINGELVVKDRDRKKLFSQLRQQFPSQSAFVTQVAIEERIIDIE